MKRKSKRLLAGILMILIGSVLFLANSQRTIRIIVDGESRIISTRRLMVKAILKEAGIPFSKQDRIYPRTNYWMIGARVITIAHRAEIDLSIDAAPMTPFVSFESIAGNVLLDGGVKLYPGDQLFLNDTTIQADFHLGGSDTKDLLLQRADCFFLLTDSNSIPQERCSSAKTVGEALRDQGISPSKSLLILPDEDTVFSPGMTITAVKLRQLRVYVNGIYIDVASGGATVGDALVRAGIPLQGADVSIPAANESLPEDGNILIVHVRDEFTMNAKTVTYGTQWQPNDALDLDTTNLLREGKSGLTGTMTRVRTENGEEAFHNTSEEQILSPAVDETREYGTKISVRTLDTPDGPIEYWRSVPVRVTSYSPCRLGVSGCSSTTASGATLKKGIAAVRVVWYRLMHGQTVYVPDYGTAVIEDTGGGVDGTNRWIDLGYSDDDFIGWSTSSTLYFLTPIPEEVPWVLP